MNLHEHTHIGPPTRRHSIARRVSGRLSDERGFTLIEVLIVTVVMGALAAISMPVFLSQAKTGGDTEAISNVRNLASQVESCFMESSSYKKCNSAADLGSTGLTLIAPGAVPAKSGEVGVESKANGKRYKLTARSSSGGTFSIGKDNKGKVTRSCVGSGKCKNGSW